MMGTLTGQGSSDVSSSSSGGSSGGGWSGLASQAGYAVQDVVRSGQEEISDAVVAEGAAQ